MSKKKLTTKQTLFLTYYLVGLSGTESAMRAYNAKSRRIAAVIASKNLKKVNIDSIVSGFTWKV